MGSHPNITHDKFPRQGSYVGRRVFVAFHYRTDHCVSGTIVRDDAEPPFETIIRLDNGKYVLGNECQWSEGAPRFERTQQVLARANEMFGNSAKTWLATPNPALSGDRPISVLRRDPEKVDAVLTRIEHGVVE